MVNNLLEGMLMHRPWAKNISYITLSSMGYVRANVSGKIQMYHNHTTVVNITRGRLSMHMFDKGLPFSKFELSIHSSNIMDQA